MRPSRWSKIPVMARRELSGVGLAVAKEHGATVMDLLMRMPVSEIPPPQPHPNGKFSCQ